MPYYQIQLTLHTHLDPQQYALSDILQAAESGTAAGLVALEVQPIEPWQVAAGVRDVVLLGEGQEL